MRLKNVNGSIETVVKVVASVEFRHSFNGVKRRLFEKCRDNSIQPNALVFLFEDKAQPIGICQPFGGGNEDKLILGNLTAEQAEEISNALLTEGYFDLSRLKLQKNEMILEKYKVDDGKSGAYAVATSSCFNIFTNGNGFGDGIFAQCEVPADDEEDLADEESGEDC